MPTPLRQISKATAREAAHAAGRELLARRNGTRIHSCAGNRLPNGAVIPPCKFLAECKARDPYEEVICELTDEDAGKIAAQFGWDYLAVPDPVDVDEDFE